MKPTILGGKKLSDCILENVKQDIIDGGHKPTLVIISVGDDEASKVYIGKKIKACEEVGIKVIHRNLVENTPEGELECIIIGYNNATSVDGILVQLPLPKHLDPKLVQRTISPDKDVDGISFENIGRLDNNSSKFVPCTADGIVTLLDYNDIHLKGKHVVVVGRSSIVGKPVSKLLLNRDCTVTICHSHTQNLQSITRQADILVVAVGKPFFIQAKHVKDGAIVIDVGINKVPYNMSNPGRKKLVGDVDYEGVTKYVPDLSITPVPGGVGPLTVSMLMRNVLKAYLSRNSKD